MSAANFVPSVAYWMFRAGRVQEMVKREGGKIGAGFPGAEITEPHFLFTDPLHVTGFTLYLNGGIAQLAVLEAKRMVEKGLQITIVAKNISDMLAKDLVLAGACVSLIDYDTRPIRVYNLVMDGIFVHAILNQVGWGQVRDLKSEETEARKKGGKGGATVYVLGDFGPKFVARVNSKGVPYKKGKGKRDDITEAGGFPVDMEGYKRFGSGFKELAYALG